MTEERKINKYYCDLANELIENVPALEYLTRADVTIGFLSSNLAKVSNNKIVYGVCEKTQDKYKWAIPYDFTITLYEPNCAMLPDEVIKRVLTHELLHIGYKTKEDGSPTFFINHHDVEDFRYMIDNFGLDWVYGE